MKKLLLIMLSALLALSLVSCGGEKKSGEGDNTESVTEMDETKTADESRVQKVKAYRPDHYYMDDLRDVLKTYGRMRYEGHKLTADWSGCGIGMNVFIPADDSQMTVSYSLNYSTVFAVLVDGEQQQRPLVTGSGMIKIPLSAGEHEISVVKENEISIDQQSYCYITEVGVRGSFYERPEDRKYYIEVIGDSIACGDGCLGTFQEGVLWGKEDHSALASFGCTAAKILDADYSLVARGGIGALKARDAVGLPMPAIYPYTSPYRDRNELYDFASARTPDLIIYELGANDSGEYTVDEYYAATLAFLDEVQHYYGDKNIPVVWTGRVESYAAAIRDRYPSDRPDVPFFVFHYVYGESGAGGSTTTKSGHPNKSEQQAYGAALVNFIREKGLLAE